MAELTRILVETSVVGNELWRWIALFFILLLSLIAGKVVRVMLDKNAARLLQRQHEFSSTVLVALSPPSVFIAFIIGLRLGLSALVLPEGITAFIREMLQVLITLCIAYVAYRFVDVVTYWLAAKARRTTSKMDVMLVPLVRTSLRITVVIMAILQVATMLSDKPLTSLIAGLGVGGLALALAAQDTVKNLFGSLVIFGDKPFELGDRVNVDGHDGTIETVGFRSTRLRTLEGHLVTIPNGELANKTIQNVSKRPFVRRIMNVTITYDTPPEKVELALEILKDILKDNEGRHEDYPPRVFFNGFNDTSLNLFAIYWYFPADWWAFNALGERINMALLRRFNEAGIEFAFPTQTLFLAGDPNRPFKGGGEVCDASEP